MSDMITIEMIIGADNDTRACDRERIGKILDRGHDGWTMVDAVGAWQRGREDSVMVILTDDRPAVAATLAALREELHQDAIAYRLTTPLALFTGSESL